MNKLIYNLMSLNNYKPIKNTKIHISDLAFKILNFKKKLFKKGKKKRRLFTTTGNISLINALTIIKQLGETNCEDYLIIDSFKGSYNFWKTNCEIAKLHNFKSIKCIFNIKFDIELKLFNWPYFDEIYTLNHGACLPAIMELYPDAKINLFDEGCGSLVLHNKIINNIQNFNAFYTHKYIDKIDYFGLPEKITNKIIPLNVDIFKKIATQIEEKYPLNIKINPDDKNILYCGIYWECSGLNKEEFIKEQKKQIDELVNSGYKILFKPHPRETAFYNLDENPNVVFIDSVLPVELYNWDILAVVAMSCSTLIHLPHYHNIPAFSNIAKNATGNRYDRAASRIIRFFIGEYSTNYKELLKLDVKNISKENLKQQINQIYINFLKDKPLLSQNEKVKEYATQHRI